MIEQPLISDQDEDDAEQKDEKEEDAFACIAFAIYAGGFCGPFRRAIRSAS